MNSCRILPAMRTLAILTISLLRCFLALFRSRDEQAIVELALRQQLAAEPVNDFETPMVWI